MDTKLHNVKRLTACINRSLFTVCGRLDYPRITEALILLSNVIHDYPGDGEDLWYIENSLCDLPELIIGAYWHYAEWHGGQASQGYAALCALGQIFSPGMSCPEDDNIAYCALNELAARTL
jgi:hypothetical protein